jgi:subtilisin family serine protease
LSKQGYRITIAYLFNGTWKIILNNNQNYTVMKKSLSKYIPVLLIVLAGCTKDIETTSAKTDLPVVSPSLIAKQNNTVSYVPNELLVKFRSGSAVTHRSQALQKIEGIVKEKLLTKAMHRSGDTEGIQLITIPGDVKAAVAKMNALPEVEYAEPNYIFQHTSVSNDPFYTDNTLWNMYGDASPLQQNQYGSQAAEAWTAGHTGSSTMHIGIIDQGLMISHPDLAANVWTNPYDPVDGIDNDGNGYIDDIHGWDFNRDDNEVFDGVNDWHGTHVAGIIGAKGGNGVGVAGVNWNIKLISSKFLGKQGGSLLDAIKAIDYLTDLKTRHNLKLPATNNSWGGGPFTQSLADAITRAEEADILFIAAAGNSAEDNDVTPMYPAAYTNSNIISVAAINSSGGLASFSSFGLSTVDLGAPGDAVFSTYLDKYKGKPIATYDFLSGTSMATPHVTGAVALYVSQNPGATGAQIKNAILSSATPTPSLAGKTVTGGRLNLSNF